MLRGESLAISEGAPALVEHGGNLMMIEPGAAQPPDGWPQDVPAAMRTPSLEARQANLLYATTPNVPFLHSGLTGLTTACSYALHSDLDPMRPEKFIMLVNVGMVGDRLEQCRRVRQC
jgi:hypothetical protein